MDRERAAKADRLLEEALEQPDDERRTYVESACPDAELRKEVLSLLEWHERAGAFLEAPVSEHATPRREPRPAFSTGEIVAERFVIHRLLERGGQGEVYAAHDKVLDEPVALKTIRPEIAGSARARKRLEQEIRLARRISHPHVCRVHDVFHHSNASSEDASQTTMLLSMELLNGETLADFLRREAPIPWKRAASFLREIAMGLEAAHREGIVHRDLKPSNVMLTESTDGIVRAVLTDFGLAAGSGDGFTDAPGISSGGGTWGTPDYMSPEQFAGHKATPQSDLFSFGVVAHEVLFGGKPFPPDRPSGDERLTNAPRPLLSLVFECLQPSASARPDSATSVRKRIERNVRAHRWRQQLLRVAGAAAVVGLLTVGAIAYHQSLPKTIDWTAGTKNPEAAAAMFAGLQSLRDAENLAAIPHFERALELDKNFLLARVKLVDALLNTGNHNRADELVDDFTAALDSSAVATEDSLSNAVLARAEFDYHQAAEIYRALWERYPDDIDLGLSLGRAYEETGELERSLNQYVPISENAETVAATLGIGRMLVNRGNPQQAITTLQLQRETLADMPEAMGMLYSILGVAERDLGRFSVARAELRRSLSYRQTAGDIRGQSATLTNLGGVEWRAGQTDTAVEALRRALELARRSGDVTYESFALVNLGATAMRVGQLREALALHGESLEIELRRGEFMELSDRLSSLARLNLLMGRYEETMVLINQALGYGRQAGDSTRVADILDLRGKLHHAKGKPLEAVAAFEESFTILADLGKEVESANIKMHMVRTHLSTGHFKRAWRLLSEHSSLASQTPEQTFVVCASVARSAYYLAIGQVENAREELRSTRENRSLSDRELSLSHLLLDGESRLIQGELDSARAIVEGLKRSAVKSDFYDLSLGANLQLARLHTLDMAFDEAELLLNEAIEHSEVRRTPPRIAETMLLMSELKLAAGDYESADSWARKSIDVALGYMGRPILFKAYAVLGLALRRSGKETDSADVFTKARETHAWLVRHVPEQHLRRYVTQPHVASTLDVISDSLNSASQYQPTAPSRPGSRR